MELKEELFVRLHRVVADYIDEQTSPALTIAEEKQVHLYILASIVTFVLAHIATISEDRSTFEGLKERYLQIMEEKAPDIWALEAKRKHLRNQN